MPTRILIGSFLVGGSDVLHRSIRDARAGGDQAIATLLDAVGPPARTVWPEVTSGLVVPVPGHQAGAGLPIVRDAAAVVAAARDWSLASDGLRRVRDVPEAKVGGPRDRATEVATLEWRRDPRGEVIILVDDVLRTGETLRACAAAIHDAGDDRRVIAIIVARALPG